jgi:peptide/nickel transport system substrate-binding protein
MGRRWKGGTTVRRELLAVALAAVVAVVIAQPGSSTRGQEGGILRISFSPNAGLDFLDPALSFSQAGWSLLEATCARLYTYPDKWSPTSFRLQPEAAAGYSRSADLKTYTFTLRRGFRFNNGEPVRASAFARAIDRVLQPVVQSPGAIFMRDIVGADDVLSGRAKTARGVVARGNTLVVRFNHPTPNFVARTTLPFFCAVPPWLPVSAEGLGAFPSAGPYYVKEYRANEGIQIRRNRFYGGERKVHLDGFDVNLRGGSPVELLKSIERGDADWGHMFGGVFATPGLDFEAKYGRNRSRFWVQPGLTLRMLAFNSARPLFRNNPRLRRAVNLALDRRALVESSYGPVLSRATDQLLPPGVPGFRDADVYPLEGELARAQKLARGHLRNAKAVLSVSNIAAVIETAQLVKEQLAKIGLRVEIVRHSGGDFGPELLANLTSPRAEWDIAFLLWTPNIRDAHEYLSLLLETRLQGGETLTRVRSRLASAALARAALLPKGRARDLAYAEVDAMIARDVAPVAVLSVLNEATIVSKRVGCMILRPALDLAVACLKE